MSKKEAKIKSFMITQDYNFEHFNTQHGPIIQNIQGKDYEMFYWSDNAKLYIENNDIAKVTDMVRFLLCSSVNDTNNYYNDDVVRNIYGITHDNDTREVWADSVKEYVIEKKFTHFHIVVDLGIPMTLEEISYKLNIAPQYIEKPKTGPYGYDNFLSYLIHAKDTDKYQYCPDDVFSHQKNKTSYKDVYAERRSDWLKGAAKKTRKRAINDVDGLEQAVLKGEITKDNILYDDFYYQIYAANTSRIDNAFDCYLQRKMYFAVKAMERGEFRTCIFFITGKSGSGKSYFTDALIKGLIDFVKEVEGQDWTYMDCAASNPVDNYLGQEIVKMDDLRGASMSASDWLKLLDPERASDISARYHNKKMVPRCIIINSVQDPLTYFYYAKAVGGGDRSEPMDQFLRRIIANIQVYVVPDEQDPHNPALFDRRMDIGVCQLDDKRTVVIGQKRDYWGVHAEQVNVSYDFKPDYNGRDLSNMTSEEALQFLINTVWYWNFGALHTSKEVNMICADDDYIHHADISPKPDELTEEEAAEEQAFHEATNETVTWFSESKDDIIDEIIYTMKQNLYYTDASGQQCSNQPLIDGLESGTLTVVLRQDKIVIVPNENDDKKDGVSDESN